MRLAALPAALGACDLGPAPAVHQSLAPSQPSPVPPTVRPSALPKRWAHVYHRACTGSITAPVSSSDGQSVSSCGARFTLEKGQFLGAAPRGLLALLPDDRALVDEYRNGGLTLLGRDGGAVRDEGGEPRKVAVAKDRTRVVSLEVRDDERSLVLRELPSLKRVRQTALGSGPTDAEIGLLVDGREVLFASYPCTETACTGKHDKSCRQVRCGDKGLFVVNLGTVKPLVPGLQAAALGAGGDLAAVVRADGSAALLALPDGHSLAELPHQNDGAAITAMAVSPTGDRVALAWDDRLSVYAVQAAGVIEVLTDKRHFTRSLRFTPDGRTLLAGDDLGAYREGATPHQTPALHYDVKLPRGFVELKHTDDGWESPAAPGFSSSGNADTTAVFHHPKLGASVYVSAIDPYELAADGDANAWAQRATARFGSGNQTESEKEHSGERLLAWSTSHGRSLELHWVGHGCDVIDNYERISENGGALYRVNLEIPGELSARRITPWLTAFFDAPLGISPARTKEQALASDKRQSANRNPASKRM